MNKYCGPVYELMFEVLTVSRFIATHGPTVYNTCVISLYVHKHIHKEIGREGTLLTRYSTDIVGLAALLAGRSNDVRKHHCPKNWGFSTD